MLSKRFDLDTANLNDIKELVEKYPIAEISSNPGIIEAEGGVDFITHMQKIRKIVGEDITIHCQVVSSKFEGIINDATLIYEILGEKTNAKIPVTEDGLHAIKYFTDRGKNVTATACFTTNQGISAVLAGAKTCAFYYTSMLDYGLDANLIIRQMRKFIDETGSDCMISGAHITSVAQIPVIFEMGVDQVALPPQILREMVACPGTENAIRNFTTSWERLYGVGETVATAKK